MKATTEWIRTNFNKFNEKYFDGKLRQPDVIRTSSRCSKVLGKVSPRFSPYYGMRITLTISTYFDREERNLQQTLIHEMIHIYQLQTYGYGDHGETFKREARRINRDGWSISRYTSLYEEFGNDFASHVIGNRKLKMTGKVCGIIERKTYVFVFCISENSVQRISREFPEAKLYRITDPKQFEVFPLTGNGRSRIAGKRMEKGGEVYRKILNALEEI